MKLWQVCSNSLRNGYSKIFEVADYESQNKKSRIQYGGQLHDFLVKPCQFRSNSLMNDHSGVIEVVDYESEVRISKFKMADLMAVKYIIFEWNFDIFALVRLGTANQRFLRSPITNLKSSHSWDKVSNFFKFTHQIEKKNEISRKTNPKLRKSKKKINIKEKRNNNEAAKYKMSRMIYLLLRNDYLGRKCVIRCSDWMIQQADASNYLTNFLDAIGDVSWITENLLAGGNFLTRTDTNNLMKLEKKTIWSSFD